MFKVFEKLMDEKEDRGDDLPGANPFVGGEGENGNDTEAEDRGDLVVDEGAADDDASSETETPAEDATDSDDAADDSDGDGDDDAGDAEDGDDGGEDDGDDEEQPTSPMIPKKRFDSVNERMKRAEARLAELERQREATAEAQEDTFDFDEKEKEYMEAVLDADADRALALRNEIRAAEQARFEAQSNTVTSEAVKQSALQREFDENVAVLEAHNPVLDPDSDTFDEDLVGEIVNLQKNMVLGGSDLTPGEALVKAAQYVMGNKLLLDEAEAEEETPPPPKPKKNAGNVKGKVAAAKKQAPNLTGGESSSAAGEGTVNIDDLTEAEFDALPESKKQALRGDII